MENYYKILKKYKNDNFQKFYDIGFLNERNFSACGQSAVAPFVELLGINKEIYKATSGLLGGIGYMGDTCGAYVAGVIVISYIFGREYEDLKDNVELGKEKYRKTGRIVREFRKKFIEKYGTINCREVQKKIFGKSFNLLNPEDRAASELAGSHIDKCTSVVGNAAKMVAEVIYLELANNLNN